MLRDLRLGTRDLGLAIRDLGELRGIEFLGEKIRRDSGDFCVDV